MNIFLRRMNVLLLCAAVATAVPMYSMENEGVEVVEQQQVEEVTVEQKPCTPWHKKRSVRIAAVTTAAVGFYALAVRMGAVAVPVVLAGWFAARVAQNKSSVNAEDNNDVIHQGNNSVVIDQEDNQQQSGENNQVDNGEQLSDTLDQHDNQLSNVKVEQKIEQQSSWQVNQLFDKLGNFYKQSKVVAEQWKNSIVKTTEEDLKQIHI